MTVLYTEEQPWASVGFAGQSCYWTLWAQLGTSFTVPTFGTVCLVYLSLTSGAGPVLQRFSRCWKRFKAVGRARSWVQRADVLGACGLPSGVTSASQVKKMDAAALAETVPSLAPKPRKKKLLYPTMGFFGVLRPVMATCWAGWQPRIIVCSPQGEAEMHP